jgi:hypothetical protein
MLADDSISWAVVSKAKPKRGPASHRGTRTPAGGHRGGPASGGVGGGGAAYRLQELSYRGEGLGAAAEEDQGRGGGESGRGAASERCASVRADVGVTDLAGGGRRHCVRVEEERRDTSEKGGASKKRGASGTSAARRGGDDDRGREARQRFGVKRLSANLEGNGLYIEPRPFVTGRIHNRDKRPIILGSYYDPRLKTPPFVTSGLTTRDKRGISRGMP